MKSSSNPADTETRTSKVPNNMKDLEKGGSFQISWKSNRTWRSSSDEMHEVNGKWETGPNSRGEKLKYSSRVAIKQHESSDDNREFIQDRWH